MAKDDGGPAFPRAGFGPVRVYEGSPAESEVTYEPEDGMSLRDWFAGQALAGMSAALGDTQTMATFTILADQNKLTVPAALARSAYSMADAMIEARKK